jgi:hypothetical protein
VWGVGYQKEPEGNIYFDETTEQQEGPKLGTSSTRIPYGQSHNNHNAKTK